MICLVMCWLGVFIFNCFFRDFSFVHLAVDPVDSVPNILSGAGEDGSSPGPLVAGMIPLPEQWHRPSVGWLLHPGAAGFISIGRLSCGVGCWAAGSLCLALCGADTSPHANSIRPALFWIGLVSYGLFLMVHHLLLWGRDVSSCHTWHSAIHLSWWCVLLVGWHPFRSGGWLSHPICHRVMSAGPRGVLGQQARLDWVEQTQQPKNLIHKPTPPPASIVGRSSTYGQVTCGAGHVHQVAYTCEWHGVMCVRVRTC